MSAHVCIGLMLLRSVGFHVRENSIVFVMLFMIYLYGWQSGTTMMAGMHSWNDFEAPVGSGREFHPAPSRVFKGG